MVEWLMLLLILGAIIVVILMTTIVQIEQYESGVALRLGKYHSMLNPGWNFVVPLYNSGLQGRSSYTGS